ncbi:ferric-chelate reductase Frp1 [Oleoguttula sp. CCFEE 5521]
MEALMGSMSSMDMGMFTSENKAIALGYWYAIASVTGLLLAGRLIASFQSHVRRASFQRDDSKVPSRTETSVAQAYATVITTLRELGYSQPLWFSGSLSKCFTPPPLGQCLLLAAYWLMLLIMLWSNVILTPSSSQYAYKWEKVGFRAAWVSVTQIPFIYLLSCKFNPISLLTGVSYVRLNWLHRWSARTVFLTIIVHWAYFFREWVLSDLVKWEFQLMPMVKYGFGAWAVIGWMTLTGFGFFRALNHELFVVQHICAAAALLWLLYVHVPAYAQYNIWLSVAFVAFDWLARIMLGVLRNTHILSWRTVKAAGYSATAEALPGNMTRLTIFHADFTWKAGQHIHLSMPTLRPFEVHPFTISNTAIPAPSNSTNTLELMIRAHSGFTRSLHNAARKDALTGKKRRVFINGPWGMPPDLRHFETVVLIACASGASYITPILQRLVTHTGCVAKLHVHWIIRSAQHLTWFESSLRDALRKAQLRGMRLQITVHVTQTGDDSSITSCGLQDSHGEISAIDSEASSLSTTGNEKQIMSTMEETIAQGLHADLRVCHASRPTVESMIRPPVEVALGETAIVTCGGLVITAQTRNFVAALSDERAVHKGTGAQGIFMHNETYGY